MKIKNYFLKLILILMMSISYVTASSSRPSELVENFDLRYYHPQQLSLIDLSFDVHISNLKENVLKSIPLSQLDDLYYSVYWMTPGRFHIEVIGLPKGYIELKNELRALVRSRLDYVLPQKLAPKVRSYKLKIMQGNGKYKIEGVDITHQRQIDRIEIEFAKNGKLESFTVRSPTGSEKSTLKMSSKLWSKNKWVIDEVIVTTIQGIKSTTMKNQIFYEKFDGFGFPKKIKVTTSQKIKLQKEKAYKRVVKSEITFSNYKVNSGVAKKRLMDLSARK